MGLRTLRLHHASPLPPPGCISHAYLSGIRARPGQDCTPNIQRSLRPFRKWGRGSSEVNREPGTGEEEPRAPQPAFDWEDGPLIRCGNGSQGWRFLAAQDAPPQKIKVNYESAKLVNACLEGEFRRARKTRECLRLHCHCLLPTPVPSLLTPVTQDTLWKSLGP